MVVIRNHGNSADFPSMFINLLEKNFCEAYFLYQVDYF